MWITIISPGKRACWKVMKLDNDFKIYQSLYHTNSHIFLFSYFEPILFWIFLSDLSLIESGFWIYTSLLNVRLSYNQTKRKRQKRIRLYFRLFYCHSNSTYCYVCLIILLYHLFLCRYSCCHLTCFLHWSPMNHHR